MARPQWSSAVTVGVVTAALWQALAEVRFVADASRAPLVASFLPGGSRFAFAHVPDLVPDAGLWIIGALLCALLVGVVVAVGVRSVYANVTAQARSWPSVLACWMLVIIAIVVAALVSIPIANQYGPPPGILNSLYAAAGGGLVIGWIPALLARMLAQRRS